MARRRTGRFSTTLALLIALGGALIVGGALVITRPFTPLPIATVATPFSAATSVQPAITAASTTTATASPAPANPSTTQPRTPTPAPAAWTIIGRWQADQLIITEPFTTPGPWRLCWAQPDARILFQVMVGNPEQTAWDLLSGPTGATTGAFDFPQRGSYRLMFHSETPYTALVLARSGDASAEPPPCG